MEIILSLGLIEGLVICIEMIKRNRLLKANNLLIDTMNKAQELEDRRKRREIEGTFQNPLGDTYRKNTKGQLRPIIPRAKMLDGDEDDEV